MSTVPSPELLAPAGNPAAFYAALAAGANAIYCAIGSDFNARRAADNFTAESFAEACRVAHIAGAQVFVTQNIVIRADEMPHALEVARRAWCLGADALIIQDLGLLSEVHRRYPEIEIHASTQMNIHDARGVRFVHDELGVERVTISRELSLDEIACLAQEHIPLESFAHGALCFCYSGLCLLSSLKGGRSANRGLCAQPCRLPQELIDEQTGNNIAAAGRERLLCPRDNCTIDDLSALVNTGVASLKIEGRMKNPDYVWSVVSAYREELDELQTHKQSDDPVAADVRARARRRRIKRVFNRTFTDTYLHGRSDNALMSYERSNNRGELVGEVLSSRDLGTYKAVTTRASGGGNRVRMHRKAEVEVRLDAPIGKGDLIEVRPLDEQTQFQTTLAPFDAQAGEIITLTCVRPAPPKSTVRVIRSQAALDAASHVARPDAAPKRQVSVYIRACLGKPFLVELSSIDGSACAHAEGFVVEGARTRPVTQEDLIEHVGRMGTTPFEAVEYSVELDANVGMSFSAIHEIRAEACRLLEEQLLSSYSKRAKQAAPAPRAASITTGLLEVRQSWGISDPYEVKACAPVVCALVTSPEAAYAARQAGAMRLYAREEALAEGTWPSDVIPWLDEVCREADHKRIDPFIVPGEPVGIGNLSELALARSCGAAFEIRPAIPVHNESCLVELERLGAQCTWLSSELTLDELCFLARRATRPVGMLVLGRPRAMTSEHCILQAANRCIEDCSACKLRQRAVSLVDIDDAHLPVKTDTVGRSRVYGPNIFDATPELDQLIAGGISRFMVDCTLIDVPHIKQAVSHVVQAIAAVEDNKPLPPRLSDATTCHLYSAIE